MKYVDQHYCSSGDKHYWLILSVFTLYMLGFGVYTAYDVGQYESIRLICVIQCD